MTAPATTQQAASSPTYSPSGSLITAPQYGTGTPDNPINLSELIQAAQTGNTAAQQELGELYRDGTISTGGAPLPPYALATVGAVRTKTIRGRILVQAPNGTWLLL